MDFNLSRPRNTVILVVLPVHPSSLCPGIKATGQGSALGIDQTHQVECATYQRQTPEDWCPPVPNGSTDPQAPNPAVSDWCEHEKLWICRKLLRSAFPLLYRVWPLLHAVPTPLCKHCWRARRVQKRADQPPTSCSRPRWQRASIFRRLQQPPRLAATDLDIIDTDGAAPASEDHEGRDRAGQDVGGGQHGGRWLSETYW